MVQKQRNRKKTLVVSTLKYYLTFYWLVIQLAYFHMNSVGYYEDIILEFVIIMRRIV